jgi:hypothetical protein
MTDVKRYREALEEIATEGPTEEPAYEDWGGSTEKAEKYGIDLGMWVAAEIARAALKDEDAP